MDYEEYFWNASIKELKQGYFYKEKEELYTCLICGKTFEDGILYNNGYALCTAKKSIVNHIEREHGSSFEFFLDMGKSYTGLTDHQKELMKLFYKGYSDKEIVAITGATSTSTIRNQRFTFREKYKQAKIIVAMSELLEERRANVKKDNRTQNESLVDIHRTATMVDERYAITQSEKSEVLSRYFDSENRLIIKEFPARQKRKIIILQQITKEFEPNRCYTEKEVNNIIKNYYEDNATIRRYLIEYGFLTRTDDCREYWVKQ